ncbi:MAG: hypothetical protein EP335_14145 [Alphaproteobacteria bacterium]|nr:MAG: hypothetical protein EP335_14145 [Alphaproteobacteria bacterium]
MYQSFKRQWMDIARLAGQLSPSDPALGLAPKLTTNLGSLLMLGDQYEQITQAINSETNPATLATLRVRARACLTELTGVGKPLLPVMADQILANAAILPPGQLQVQPVPYARAQAANKVLNPLNQGLSALMSALEIDAVRNEPVPEPAPGPAPAPEPGPEIDAGYGDYVFYHIRDDRSFEPVAEDVFNTAYQAIHDPAADPAAYAHTVGATTPNIATRVAGYADAVRTAATACGARCYSAFIPRSLYELIATSQVMQQEMNEDSMHAWLIQPAPQDEVVHMDPADNFTPALLHMAYGINCAIVARMETLRRSPRNAVPPYDADSLDLLFRQEVRTFRATVAYLNAGNAPRSTNSVAVTDTIRVPYSITRMIAARFTLTLDRLVNMLAQAIPIECRTTNSWLLYRGTNYARDSVQGAGGFPISYGTGPLGGIYYDKDGATLAALFMVENHYGYAMPVAYSPLRADQQVFFIPVGTPAQQLVGKDQSFHAWSKIPAARWTAATFLEPTDPIPPGSHLAYMRFPGTLLEEQALYAPIEVNRVNLIQQ